MHTVSDLKNVLIELWGVSNKWYNIGLALDVHPGSLNMIKSQYTGTDCLREMLLLWLNSTNPQPTWEALVNALDECIVGEGHLSETLKTKYCGVQHQQGILYV